MLKMICTWRRMLGAVVPALGLLAAGPAPAAGEYKLVEPGVLSVAITGDMPGLVAHGDKLVGYDGEILQRAADKIGLKIKPVPMEWSGAIAAVQAGRVDLIGGNVAWTKQRAEILSLTDPTSYFQNGVAQKTGTDWHTLASLENKKVGSITGFSFLPELRKLPGLELTLYDTSDAALRDLITGRIEAMVGDPPVIDYSIAQNPGWGLHNLPFTDNNPKFPLLTSVGRQYVFGLSKDNQRLADALSAEIRKLWESCEVREIGKRIAQAWGALDSVILNAGTCEYIEVQQFDSALIERVLNTNLLAASYCIEAALPLLRAGNRPHLVGIASSVTYLALPRAGAYGASKAALRYLLQSLRIDLAAEGIDVTLVSPGFVDTPLTARNDFAMPMRWSARKAARHIHQRLPHRHLEIAFPAPFIFGLKLLSWLPGRLQLALAKRLARPGSAP